MSAVTAARVPATEWQTVRLADVCQFKPPKSIPRKALDDDSPVSFVPMGDLGELAKHFEARTVRKFGEVVKGYTYFADGDVLCAKITPCFENGKLGIAQNLENGVGFGSSEFVVMRSKGEILPEFLYYYLSRDTFREAGQAVMSGAVGHKRVPKEYFENLEIPLPPLYEQKRIVAELDKAFAGLDHALAHAETNLANSQTLYEMVLKEIFAERDKWPCESLGDRVRFLDYRGKTPPKSDRGIPLITAKNVRMGFIKTDPAEFVEEDAYEKWMTRGLPEEGDVLFTTEAPLANVAQLTVDGKVVIGQRLITMQTDRSEIDPCFLKWSLLSPQMQKDIHSQATGATVLGIKAKLLKKIPLHAPASLEKQREIGLSCETAFAKKNELEQQYMSKLENLSALRQTLLHGAFAGELT